jgi:hypothetical protein
VVHIAVSADWAGPRGFSFELMMTVSGESCMPRIPLPRAAGCAAACVPACTAARAGNEVAAADAAPRIRINDLRETPCVKFEFIEVLLEGSICRDAMPRRQMEIAN